MKTIDLVFLFFFILGFIVGFAVRSGL